MIKSMNGSTHVPRCFILGAGASQDAGYPLVGEFITTLDEWMNTATPPEFNKDDLRRLSDYRNKLRPIIEKIKSGMLESERENIERILEALKISDHHTYFLFEKLIYWMFFHFAGHGEVYDSSYFREFFSKARPGDCIISFNYDLLLEWAFRDSGIQYTYDWRDASKIRILKPHGAINLITNLDKNCDVHFNDSNDNVFQDKVGRSFTRLSEYFGDNIGCGVWDIYANKKGIPHFYWDQFQDENRQSFLILPELNKEDALNRPECQFLKLTWEHIPEVLASSQEFWVIGYNFSDSDKQARDVIGTYLRDKAKRVCLIKRAAPQSAFLKELCDKPHVTRWPMKFREYVESMRSQEDI